MVGMGALRGASYSEVKGPSVGDTNWSSHSSQGCGGFV